MNQAILINVYDRTGAQHELTVATVQSAMAQDIPTDIFVIDNGSTHDATKEYLAKLPCAVFNYEHNQSPLKLANAHLQLLYNAGYPCVLGLPNDVVLPQNLYRKMLEWPEDIIAAGMHGTLPPMEMETVTRVHGDVHMSVVLIRKSGYDKMMAQYGHFFDEGFFMYASDCDLKIRLMDAGVTTAQLDILCWHYGGASHRLGIGAQAVYRQADLDRDYFTKKWGFAIGSPEYDRRIGMLYPSTDTP